MSERSSPTGRRRFLRAAVIAGIGAAVVPIAALAQPKKFAKPVKKPAVPVAPAVAPPTDEARAIAALLARRYPQLDAAKLEGITKELDQRLDGGRRLRAVKLANAAEPDTTFRA